jgi:hypothetical protein
MFLIAGPVSIVVLHALLLPVKKKDPVPDPFVHYTPFFSLFTTGLSPALVRTAFPASSSGFWCSGVKNELPSAFSHWWFHVSVTNKPTSAVPSHASGHSDRAPVCIGRAPRMLWMRPGHARWRGLSQRPPGGLVSWADTW